jgi:predicted amidohydrolase
MDVEISLCPSAWRQLKRLLSSEPPEESEPLRSIMIRIGLIQMRCEKGAVAENLAKISCHLAEAAAREIDIVGFPEMSITGYVDPNRYPQAKLRLDGPEIECLLGATRGFPGVVLVGLIEDNPTGTPFITQIVARQGQCLGYYRKRTIEHEEVDWFSAGDSVPVFHHNDLTLGIAICADIGNEAVFGECSQQGASLVLELAAPGLYGEQATRNWQSGYEWWKGECEKYLGPYARKYGIWIGVATQAGRTVDEDFPGGGYLFAPDGRRAYATPDWSPGAVYLAIDFETGQMLEV